MYIIFNFHIRVNSVTHNIFRKNIRLNHMCFIIEKDNPIGGLHMTLSKHDYANYDQFVPSFNMVHKTIHKTCFCTKFKVIQTNENRVMGKEVGEFSILLYGKMGWGVLPTNMAAAV